MGQPKTFQRNAWAVLLLCAVAAAALAAIRPAPTKPTATAAIETPPVALPPPVAVEPSPFGTERSALAEIWETVLSRLKRFDSGDLALIAALGAWLISWREAHKNNTIILEIARLTATHYRDEHGDYDHLQFAIRNRGMTIQGLDARVEFYAESLSGVYYAHLWRAVESSHLEAGFMRGSTALFEISTRNKMHERSVQVFRCLSNLRSQRPVLRIFGGGFLLCSIPLYSRLDALRLRWNRIADKARISYRAGPGDDGKGVYDSIRLLPYFMVLSPKIERFAKCVLNQYHKEIAAQEGGSQDS